MAEERTPADLYRKARADVEAAWLEVNAAIEAKQIAEEAWSSASAVLAERQTALLDLVAGDA